MGPRFWSAGILALAGLVAAPLARAACEHGLQFHEHHGD